VSSKRRRRRNQCASKIRHKSMEDANYAAYLLRRDKGRLIHAYKCQFCHHWHVGHTARQRTREKLRRLLSLAFEGESKSGKAGGAED